MARYFICLIAFFISYSLEAQVESLPCETEEDAFVGLDRKNWNNGSTVFHSQGNLHNFELPSSTFGDCKKIGELEVELTVFNVDQSNMPADCPNIIDFFINMYTNCGDFAPASCAETNIVNQGPENPLANETWTFTNPPEDFQFDGIFSFDIVPVANTGCSTGQTMLSAGSVVLDYQICVTVTIVDDAFTGNVALGDDETICPSATVTLDAGTFSGYEWGPNGETSQTINVGPGTYEVTVTDANGCMDSDDIVISAEPQSPISITPATPTVCQGETTALTVTESYPDYDWSTSEGTQSVTVGEGTYAVTITDANMCTNVESITVTSLPLSPVTLTPAAPTVCEGGTTTISVTESYADYQWSTSEGTQSIIAGEGTYTVTITDANMCTNVESITVASVPEPNAGTDNSISVCSDGQPVDIDALLGAHDPGGTWADVDGSTLDLNTNATAVDFSSVAPGIYDFTYTVTGVGPCTDDIATITVEVIAPADAGSDATETFCADPGFLDLFFLVGTGDFSGMWTDEDGASVNLANPAAVDFSLVAPGTYDFTYTLPANGPCAQSSAVLTITIEENNAGDDNAVSICDGSTVNLENLLSGDADAGGTFIDDGSFSLVGSILNTTGLAGNTFNFIYEVGVPGSSCGVDQAVITVTVETSLEAGTGSTVDICGDQIVDLLSLITDEDAGGTFTDLNNSSALVGNTVNSALLSTGTYSYEYVIGDDVTCPQDFALVTINFTEAPTIAFDETLFALCDNDTTTLSTLLTGIPAFDIDVALYNNLDALLLSTTLSATNTEFDIAIINGASSLGWNLDSLFLMPDSSYYLIVSGFMDSNCAVTPELDTVFISTASVLFNTIDTSVCGVDTLVVEGISFFEGNTTYQDTFATSRCDSIVSISVEFLDVETTLIDTQLCFGDSITLNGNTYHGGLSMDTLSFTTTSGCDSIVFIDLQFFPELDTLINATLCTGDFIVVNGNTYDAATPAGVETLASVQYPGCDSIVTIDLSFGADAMISIVETLCADESVTVGSVVFDITNDNGTVVLPGATCDTSVMVSLTFFPPSDTLLNSTVCSDFSIVINGNTYDSANDQGVETIEDSNGCDSTITIELNFEADISTLVDDTLCEGESIMVNGNIYDSTDPNGVEVLSSVSGCDSTVTIDLTFEPNFQFEVSTTICEGDSLFLDNMWQFAAGAYTDSLLSVDGCDSLIITTVVVDPCQVDIELSATNNNCPGDSDGTIDIEINSMLDLPFVIVWTNTTTGISDSTTFNIATNVHSVFGLQSGNYTIAIIDGGGTTLYQGATTIATLSSPMSLTSTITEDIACAGGVGSYAVQIAGGLAPYTLAANGTDLGGITVVENVVAGSYDLTVTDDAGCTATDMIGLQEPTELTAIVSATDASCEGNTDGSISIAAIAGGTGPYTTTLNGTAIDNTGATMLETGAYAVLVIDANGCTAEYTATVSVDESGLLAEYITDYTITLGDSAVVEGVLSTAMATYVWSSDDNSAISCTDCAFPVLSPTATATYTVVITDEAGCTQTVVVNVTVEEPQVNSQFANIFSPNGDGNNDEFVIDLSNPAIVSGVLSIYDRWGNLVHQSVAVDRLVWNGTRDGQDAAPGVYVYRLELIDTAGESDLIYRDITVVR